MFLFLSVYHLKVYHYIAMIIVFILSLNVVYQDTVVIIICSYRTPTNHSHAKPLSIPNLVNYFLNCIYVKYINAILSHIGRFFRT